MSTIISNKNWTIQKFKQTYWHFLSEALWEFIVADEYPNTIFSSLIKFSIWIEILMKNYLEKIDKRLLKISFNTKEFNNIDWITFDTIINKLDNNKFKEWNKMISFELAIKLFTKAYNVDINIEKDLLFLKNYRNWLFHYEAVDINFELTQKQFNLFKWLFHFLEKENAWYLEWELHLIYSYNFWDKTRMPSDTLDIFNKLDKYINNELIFNFIRRKVRHSERFVLYKKTNYNLNELKDWYIVDWFINPKNGERKTTNYLVKYKCPCCTSYNIIIYKNFDYWECPICEFWFSDEEFKLTVWLNLKELVYVN